MHNLQFFEFVAKFLATCLSRAQLGIHSQAQFSSSANAIELHLLADHRHFHLLLIAAELGDEYMVKFLLPFGLGTKCGRTTAQSLAYKNRHFDILLFLLQSNASYPSEIDIKECPEKIKEFLQVALDLNAAILYEDSTKVETILTQHENMIYFYNLKNESALAVSLKHKKFDIFRQLLDDHLTFGPHEDFNRIKASMKEKDLEKLRDIQYNDSEFLPGNHMYILLSNSRLGQDRTDSNKKYEVIKEAFKILNKNPLLQIILMIVAASRRFRIVFDFRFDSVEFIDPTTNGSIKGVFYLSGRIYIGAKNLFDPEKKYEALGTLAHELCHHAMNVVYWNFARPYYYGEKATKREFRELSKTYKEMSHKEDIIAVVYNPKLCSSFERHAELIVRVPHLIAHYSTDLEKLNEIREIYKSLFDIYENRVVNDMKKALPRVEANAETEFEEKEKKALSYFIISIFLGLIMIVGVGFWIFAPPKIINPPQYNFTTLSITNKEKVMNASILYHGELIQFCELFSNDSDAYSRLTSDHISQMLNNKSLDFGDSHLHYLDKIVSLSWRNLTTKLKQKFLNSDFIFQNQSLKLQMLHDSSPNSFNFLTSPQIIDVLDGKFLNVHKMISNDSTFYFEMEFTDENIQEIYFDFMIYIHGGHARYACEYKNKTGHTKTFEEFYSEFRSKNLSFQNERIKEMTFSKREERCESEDLVILSPLVRYLPIDRLESHKLFRLGFTEIFAEANETKIFILSAEAGLGKTITFKQFALRIKKMFPAKWVSYIDLNKHVQLYKDCLNVTNLLEDIFELNSDYKFELEIFRDLYSSGNVILMWNGFDEISLLYSKIILNVLSTIKLTTKNIQFVCTRPQYSEEIKTKLESKAFTIVPLNHEKQENFLRMFFGEKMKFNGTKIQKAEYISNQTQKVFEVLNQTDSDRAQSTTPLLLLLIADLASNNNSDGESDKFNPENIYDIYQKFVRKKIDIWERKNEFALNYIKNSITEYHRFDMMKFYQKYAILNELSLIFSQSIYVDAKKLKIMLQKVPTELVDTEISRIGILCKTGPKSFEFSHKTFAEYFFAQYFIDNIFDIDVLEAKEDPRVLFEMFLNIISDQESTPKMIRKFLNFYLESKGNESEIKIFGGEVPDVVRRCTQDIFFHFMNIDTLYFEILFKILKNHYTFLIELLKVDENETFFTAGYNYYHYTSYIEDFFIDLHFIQKLGQQYLTVADFEKSIAGRNQKGIIMFSSYCFYRFNNKRIVHKNYKLDKKLLKSTNLMEVFNSVIKNLSHEELTELLTSKTTPLFHETIRLHTNPEFWVKLDDLMNKTEQKMMLMDMIDPRLLTVEDEKEAKVFFDRIEKFLTDIEIFKLFSSKNILQWSADYPKSFVNIWKFFANHTSLDQQKVVLRIGDANSLMYSGGCHSVPKMNVLQIASIGFIDYFNAVDDIYKSVFNVSEIQELIAKSSEFLPFFVDAASSYECKDFIKYLKELFKGNRNGLKDFLTKFDETAYLSDFGPLSEFKNPNNCYEKIMALKNSSYFF